MVSVTGKLIFMTTQRYDPPFSKVGKRFLGILSVELDGVRARNWNAQRVIVFQSVILQHAQVVNNSAQIWNHILFWLDLWNCGSFDKLVKDTYNFAMGYLVKACRSQTTEERHRTFSNLLLKGGFHEAVRFVCYREKGVFFQPNELAGYRTVTINKIVASVL